MKFTRLLAILTALILSACAGQTAQKVESAAGETAATGAVVSNATAPAEATPARSFAFLEEGETLTTTASGLQYVITAAGNGETPQPGNIVRVHYTGRFSDGNVFDSSYDREKPLQFVVGMGQVIPGWDEGIQLLKAGSKAKFVVPPELAYGEKGVGEDIPPNSTLYFEVELLEVLPPNNEPPTKVAESDYITTEIGLKYYDIKAGDGDSPRRGEMPLVHYTAWLEDGTRFDSTRDRGTPMHFTLGVEQVIPGFEEGILSMNVGGKRQLVIPPDLAFGEKGAGDLIPPNATLIYEVELIAISDYHP